VDIYANELSITSDIFDDYNKIKRLKNMYSYLTAHELNSCRVDNDAIGIIYNILSNDPSKRDLLNFCYAFFHAPFETAEFDEYGVDEYLSHCWQYKGTECVGLAYASIMDSLAISFGNGEWKSTEQIYKDGEVAISVRNALNEKQLEEHADWIDSLKAIELVETTVSPDNKEIRIRDDHGKDKLRDFSKRICHSPYVIKVINSLPFNSKDTKFIKKVRADGVIECVLCWTDEGYGLAIKTTGRNLRETEKIAEILEEKYGE